MNTRKYLSRKVLLFCLTIAVSATVSAQLTTNRDGKLDRSFGTNGLTVFEPIKGQGEYWTGGDVVQTPDGKFLTFHALLSAPSNTNTMLSRFLNYGGPDNSFGTNGRMILSCCKTFTPIKMLVEPNGKIVLAGVDNNGVDFMVIRLTENAELDTTFGVNGIFRKDFSLPGGLSNDRAYSVLRQNDGKLIVSGLSDRYTSPDATTIYVSVLRLNSDGTIDETFGKGGVSVLVGHRDSIQNSFGSVSQLTGDGKLVVATQQYRNDENASRRSAVFLNVLRFLSNGTLDPAFSEDGIATVEEINPVPVSGLFVTAEGKVVTSTVVSLRRFNSDGSIDTSFEFDYESSGYGQAVTIAQTHNNKFLIGGIHGSSGTPLGFVGRYFENGAIDRKFSTGGLSFVRTYEQETFVVTRMVPESEGKIIVLGEISDGVTYRMFLGRIFVKRKL